MKSQRIFQAILFVLLSITFSSAARAQEAPLKEFDDYVNKALKDWQVPGIAIAIVKDDKVVLAKGYGVRKFGDATPVNERTLFAIGSSSKAFTAASIAMLVDEGKLKWDDPVTKYLPEFELYDPYVTREMTVRDLLTHRSGLDRAEFIWLGTPFGRDEILRRIRYVKPSTSFRSTFGYQNIMYLAAGQVVARVSGKSWDQFIRDRIFSPLGMATTSTSIKAFTGVTNVASPHSKIEDTVRAVPWRNIDNIAPAGSINSNVEDMAQWIRFHLGEGEYEKKRLVSAASIKELQTPQTIIRLDGQRASLYPEAHFLTYGLGWFLSDYRGRKVVEHGGAIDGMRAQVGMIPEEKLGLVVLTNLHGTILPQALMYKIFDFYLNAPQRDWSADMLKTRNNLEEQAKAAEKKAESDRVQGTSPSLALEKYAGTFESDMYGVTKVALENQKLVIRFGPNFVGDLEHWHYDTFRVKWRDVMQGKGFVSFKLNMQGKADVVSIENLSDFTRVPEPDSKSVTSVKN